MCRRFARTIGLAVGEGCEMMPIPILFAEPSSPSDIIVMGISENQGCALLLIVVGKIVRCSILGVHVGYIYIVHVCTLYPSHRYVLSRLASNLEGDTIKFQLGISQALSLNKKMDYIKGNISIGRPFNSEICTSASTTNQYCNLQTSLRPKVQTKGSR